MLYNRKWDVPVRLEPWRQRLLNAANYIEACGWCQYQSSNGDKVCASMAITCGEWNGDVLRATEEFRRVIGKNIPVWNDMPGRTKEEVIAALRKAAEHEGDQT